MLSGLVPSILSLAPTPPLVPSLLALFDLGRPRLARRLIAPRPILPIHDLLAIVSPGLLLDKLSLLVLTALCVVALLLFDPMLLLVLRSLFDFLILDFLLLLALSLLILVVLRILPPLPPTRLLFPFR